MMELPCTIKRKIGGNIIPKFWQKVPKKVKVKDLQDFYKEKNDKILQTFDDKSNKIKEPIKEKNI